MTELPCKDTTRVYDLWETDVSVNQIRAIVPRFRSLGFEIVGEPQILTGQLVWMVRHKDTGMLQHLYSTGIPLYQDSFDTLTKFEKQQNGEYLAIGTRGDGQLHIIFVSANRCYITLANSDKNTASTE